MPPTPRLPLSVLERILHFALDGDAPPATPATAVVAMSPPPDTVHLLLVYKGFSALALPLYWRSVTILKSDEWVKLWGPGKGLFVGERGKERASWVREIKINVAEEAALPMNRALWRRPYKLDDKHSLPDNALAKLTAVRLPKLKHVCFFREADDRTHWEGDTSWWETELGSDGEYSPVEPPPVVPRKRTGETIGDWRLAAQLHWEGSHKSRKQAWVEEASQDELYASDLEDDWSAEDQSNMDLEQNARELQLKEQARLRLTSLLDLANVPLETVSVRAVDEDVFSLMRRQRGRILPRVTVYTSSDAYDERDGRSLLDASLDKNVAYDFVGVDQDSRERIAADLGRKYTTIVVKRWCWVNEDGTKVAVM